MAEVNGYAGQLVFGLDIGTRSIVGTVGYKDGDRFVVVAQRVKEHETRAMLDGQIHDINKVGETIRVVKEVGGCNRQKAYGSLYCCRRTCPFNCDDPCRIPIWQ